MCVFFVDLRDPLQDCQMKHPSNDFIERNVLNYIMKEQKSLAIVMAFDQILNRRILQEK